MNHPRNDYDRIANIGLLLFVAICVLAPIAFKLGWLR